MYFLCENGEKKRQVDIVVNYSPCKEMQTGIQYKIYFSCFLISAQKILNIGTTETLHVVLMDNMSLHFVARALVKMMNIGITKP